LKRALIGHSGFVGGTLRATGGYTHCYNSRNFREMQGQSFDEIVCAGIPAVKWLANKEPDQDRTAIGSLVDVLRTARAARFVLISTIDVYPDPSQPVDEGADLSGLPNHPYGRHRWEVEQFATERFPTHAIIRLPALFGTGLKKNALFDLLHDNMVDRVNPACVFQWYPMARLADDLRRAIDAGLPLVNLVTEPVAMRDIIARFFPDAPVGPETVPAPHYALRTRHAPLFGSAPPYRLTAEEVFAHMASFIDQVRQRG